MIRDFETNRKRWITAEIKKERTKRVVKLYVMMALSGKIDWKVLGQSYRPDQQHPDWTVKRLIKQTEVKKMIDNEFATSLKNNGIDFEYTIKKLKMAIKISEEKKDAGNLLRCVENMQKLLEVEKETTRTLQFTERIDYSKLGRDSKGGTYLNPHKENESNN